MNLLFVILFGIVQGLTEFLPVSSTGHLIILEKFFNLSSSQFGLSFDVALHLGTLLALLFYFKKTIFNITTDFLKGKSGLVILLIIGTLPACIAGVILEKFVSTTFRDPIFVAVNLIIFSFVFLLAEKIGKRQKEFPDLNYKDSFTIGVFQAIALLPGVSRSGITISGGRLKNLKEGSAGQFAFLLSIPIVLIASAKDIYDLLKNGEITGISGNFFLGAGVAFIVGLLCLTYFLKYLKKHGLVPFIIYRILLAIVIFLFVK